jgi:hypothetical protein
MEKWSGFEFEPERSREECARAREIRRPQMNTLAALLPHTL